MIEAGSIEEYRDARKRGEEKIAVEGEPARQLLRRIKLRKIAGGIVIAAAIFYLPVRGAVVEPEGEFTGPAPGWRYPLSGGNLPSAWEVALAGAGLLAGILIYFIPWSKYVTAEVSEKPLRVIFLRKKEHKRHTIG